MSEISTKIRDSVYSKVSNDLLPNSRTVWLKTGLALVPGGVASLFLCGQFGLGLTSSAESFYHLIHHQVGSPLLCASICGSLFAVLPIVVLRTISHPLQFKYMLKERVLSSVLWFVLFVALLSFHGKVGADFISLLFWVVAAFATFSLLGKLICSAEKLLSKRLLFN